MIPDPTTHRIDPISGELTGATGHYSKKLSAMAGLYENEEVYRKSKYRRDCAHNEDC